MSGAGDQSKQLRDGVEKVEDLRDEEEHHCLAEVAEDPDHSKRHPSKIAVGVSHKHTRGVPTESAKVNPIHISCSYELLGRHLRDFSQPCTLPPLQIKFFRPSHFTDRLCLKRAAETATNGSSR